MAKLIFSPSFCEQYVGNAVGHIISHKDEELSHHEQPYQIDVPALDAVVDGAAEDKRRAYVGTYDHKCEKAHNGEEPAVLPHRIGEQFQQTGSPAHVLTFIVLMEFFGGVDKYNQPAFVSRLPVSCELLFGKRQLVAGRVGDVIPSLFCVYPV